MELTEDEIIQKAGNDAGIVIKILCFHMNRNGLAFHVVIT